MHGAFSPSTWDSFLLFTVWDSQAFLVAQSRENVGPTTTLDSSGFLTYIDWQSWGERVMGQRSLRAEPAEARRWVFRPRVCRRGHSRLDTNVQRQLDSEGPLLSLLLDPQCPVSWQTTHLALSHAPKMLFKAPNSNCSHSNQSPRMFWIGLFLIERGFPRNLFLIWTTKCFLTAWCYCLFRKLERGLWRFWPSRPTCVVSGFFFCGSEYMSKWMSAWLNEWVTHLKGTALQTESPQGNECMNEWMNEWTSPLWPWEVNCLIL